MQRLWRSWWRSSSDSWRWIETAAWNGRYLWKCCTGNSSMTSRLFQTLFRRVEDFCINRNTTTVKCFGEGNTCFGDITSETDDYSGFMHFFLTNEDPLIKMCVQIGIHYGGIFYEFVPWNGVVSWEVDPWGHWRFSAENETYSVITFMFLSAHNLFDEFPHYVYVEFWLTFLIDITSSRWKWRWPQKIPAVHYVRPPQNLASVQLAGTLVSVI